MQKKTFGTIVFSNMILLKEKKRKTKSHYRTLQIIHKAFEKSYNDLLLLNRDISIYEELLHFWATKG